MGEFYSILRVEIQDFLTLRRAHLSISGYSHDVCYLKSFDTYLSHLGLEEKKITEATASGWVGSLTGKSSSRANKVITLRIFTKYLLSLGITAHVPVIPKVADDYIPYIFSDAELERIFTAADSIRVTKNQTNPNMQIEFPMIIRLLYGCGLRIGETLALQMKDVDLDSDILTMLHTKRDKQRLVPLSQSLAEILRNYCLSMGIVGIPSAYLFPGVDPVKPASVESIKNKFRAILRNLDIVPKMRVWHERGPCLHCFRHVFTFKSFAQAERNGHPIDDSIPFLSVYLGHEGLDETEKYLKFSSEMYPEALEMFESYTENVFPEVTDEL